ncbi:MAG: hypothetical protein Q8P18_03865 [Pseudomonadota bacterium]|nr:hypothetical protein [Pseudomonadota bacterium]
MLTRNPDGTWLLTEAREGEIAVPPLGVRLLIADVYAGFDTLAGEG